MKRSIHASAPLCPVDALKHVAIEAMVKGKPLPRARVETHLRALPKSVRLSASALLDDLAANGCLTYRDDHGTKLIHILNWSTGDAATTNLGHALEPYLRDDDPRENEGRHHLKTALRRYFHLPARAPSSAIIAAAVTVDAADFPYLPGKVYARTKALVSERVAQSEASFVRRLLRYAAIRDLIPIVVGGQSGDDAWTALEERYFSGSAICSGKTHRSAQKGDFRLFRRTLLEGCGIEAFDGATFEHLASVVSLLRARAEYKKAARVKTLINKIGRVFNEGPSASAPATVCVALQPVANGRAVNCDDLPNLLLDNGYSAEWYEDMKWYSEYSTMTAEAYRRVSKAEFPPRPASRILAQGTMKQRSQAVRCLLWIADTMLPAEERIDRADIRPIDVFGVLFPRLISLLRESRAARGTSGELRHLIGGALRHTIGGAGLIALALCQRSLHKRGVRSRIVEDHLGRGRKAAVMRPDKLTEDESFLLAAYEHSRDEVALVVTELHDTGPSDSANTIKDVRIVVRDTPPAFWIALQLQALSQIEVHLRSGAPLSRDAHELICMAFVLGVLLSTGLRTEEICHLRYGTHYADRAERRWKVRRMDRKNHRSHECVFREEYLPVWLEELYENTTRPWFMSKLKGRKIGHDWVIVTPSGSPYGLFDEAADGTGRSSRAISNTKTQLRIRWQEFAARTAISLGLKFPTDSGRFTPHELRNAMGAGLFLRSGETEAANWLGDDVGSVRDHYAALSGCYVDTSGLASVVIERAKTGVSSVAPSPGRIPPASAPYRESSTVEGLVGNSTGSGDDDGRRFLTLELTAGRLSAVDYATAMRALNAA